MPPLSESFVKNFYKREQKEFQVGAIQLEWDALFPEKPLTRLLQARDRRAKR